MAKISWKIGARLHHVKYGSGTIISIRYHERFKEYVLGWKIKRDNSMRLSGATHDDRNGWHIVNSKTADCILCNEEGVKRKREARLKRLEQYKARRFGK